MKHLRKLIIMLLTITALSSHAQCTLENTAFKSGEVLTYNLYYNWKFVWVKVGTASLSTVQTYWNGKNVFKSSLITRGNGKLDGFFVMRDTLLSYTTTQLAPLYFRKGAREGKGYRVDEVLYDYSGGKCNLRMFRKKDDKPGVWKTESSALCVLDMLNLFVRARSFDNSNWKPGWTLKLPIADGDGLADAHLRADRPLPSQHHLLRLVDRAQRCEALDQEAGRLLLQPGGGPGRGGRHQLQARRLPVRRGRAGRRAGPV